MSISDGDYELAIKIVLESSNASCSHLQRKLNWGYARASMAIDRMEREFIVGAMSTAGKRDVLPPCVHELWEKSQQQEKEIQALKRPLKLEKVLVLMDQFKKTRTFKLFYSTLFRFNEDLNCFVSTEKWRDKEAELLTVAWWMFAEVAKHQAVPEGFVLLPIKDAKFFSHDGDNYEVHDTLVEAKYEAECAIEHYRERLADQLSDPRSDGNFQDVGYGVVLAKSGYSIDHVVTQADIDKGDYSYEVGTEILSLFLIEAQEPAND